MGLDDQLVSDHETEAAIRQMEVQAVNFAYRFTNDIYVRQGYIHKTRESAPLRQKEWTWESWLSGIPSVVSVKRSTH